MKVRRAMSYLVLMMGLQSPGLYVEANELPDSGGEREIVLIVDTSGSMKENDIRRYTLQLSQILADLSEDRHGLTVVRMPRSGGCHDGSNPQLALRLDSLDRQGFETALDAHLRFDSGTHFAAPIRTAIHLLNRTPDARRLLLVIADSGGLGKCEKPLAKSLLDLRADGVQLAAVHLGSTTGAFDGHPAFDSTMVAGDAQELVAAVSQVYQRFLGVKKTQFGRVLGRSIRLEIAPYVRTAYLVVAADGDVGTLFPSGGHPVAASMDLNYRHGGAAVGLDGRRRTYRILRLEDPSAGQWSFELPELEATAGWMLIQDISLGVRRVSDEAWVAGQPNRLEVEVYDLQTGRRVDDLPTSTSTDFELTVSSGDQRVALRDDGQGADLLAGDGIFSVKWVAEQGAAPARLRLENAVFDQSFAMRQDIVDGRWKIVADIPSRVEVGVDAVVEVRVVAEGHPSKVPPRSLVLEGLGNPVELRDAGAAGDRMAGDGIYGGRFRVEKIGVWPVWVRAQDGDAVAAQGRVEGVGRLILGPVAPVHFGVLEAEESSRAELDLSSAEVVGTYRLRLETDFHVPRFTLEIDPGDGFRPLQGANLRLDAQRQRFPLRLRVSSCPKAVSEDSEHRIFLTGTDEAGEVVRLEWPLHVEVKPEPWLHCWWPLLAGGFGVLTFGFGMHGFLVPARFPPRMGLVMAQDDDLTEGFFHPFRGQRGSGIRFYRNARLYLHPDFRLSPVSSGAIARLRAEGNGVRLLPTTAIERCCADGAWEPLPADEARLRSGVLHRDALGNLYFELRNR